jgi:diguanylate cyclase (GGDEF)-like protein
MRTQADDGEAGVADMQTVDLARISGLSLAEVLKMVAIPLFVIDRNHRVICWNRAIECLTGMSGKDVLGTDQHWRALYASKRPTMADLVVDAMHEEVIDSFYDGNYGKSTVLDAAYETECFFPALGDKGKWLLCTAAPLLDASGSIVGAVETLLDTTERKRVEENLRESEQRYREMSITDSLTKLFNSRHFFNQLKLEAERAERYGHPLSLMLLDIDNFKEYNDLYGHLEGDRALVVLADVIRKTLRVTDTAFRYGGEEFTVILPETDAAESLEVAERLRKGFAASWLSPLSKLKCCVTISIGVSRYLPGETVPSFLDRVDGAMYRAKQRGKNQVCQGNGTEQNGQVA